MVCEDHTVSKEKFTIVSCDQCGFRFTNPRPAESEIGKYYKAEAYVSHTDTKKGVVNRAYHTVRNITLKQKLKIVNRYSSNKELLDVGCGTGAFLNQCKTNGWNVTGLEPDEDARAIAQQNYGIVPQPISDLSTLPANQFGAVTLWHVLEHVHQLHDTIQQLKRVLHQDGVLIIAVPNCSSKDASIYKEQWAAYDVPRHLYHFVPVDIKNLFESIDMEVVETLPMKFDAYYVSMLSEQIKGGGMFKGVINGWKSNLAANSSDNTYSSQIYLIRNKQSV